MFTIVTFVHNTIKNYRKVTLSDLVVTFIEECGNVNERADLDIRDQFITYSDDEVMVQIIGPITSTITYLIQNAVDDLKSN
jgi:Ni2+-binding GTPase involved in maturation of urease and hydrogenase